MDLANDEGHLRAPSLVVIFVQTILQLASIWLLFRSDSSDWFASHAVDPASLMMRPKPIIWFERVMLLAVALGLLNTALEWDYLASLNPTTPAQPYISWSVFFGLYLLLLWLVSRRGSAIARGTFLILVVAAVLLAFISPPPSMSLGFVTAAIAVAQYLLALAGVELVFQTDAKPWFDGRRMSVDPEIFR